MRMQWCSGDCLQAAIDAGVFLGLPPAQHSGLCQQLGKQYIPLADRFFIVIAAAAGLATFHQTLLHHVRGTVKEQHLQGDVATVIPSKPTTLTL
jgi:hypothetical protein